MSEAKYDFPTEIIELPSQGLPYEQGHFLSGGKVTIKYMTAKEEDILSNKAYIDKDIVLDKLLQSVIVDKFKYDDLLTGDKNAILIATRILGYGSEYSFQYRDNNYTVELSELENKPLHECIIKGSREITFTTPNTGDVITFNLTTHKDEADLASNLKALKKIYKEGVPEKSETLKHIITSVNGEDDKSVINDYVNKRLLARDSLALRKFIREVTPDVDFTFFPYTNSDVAANIPITAGFLWPDIE